MNSLLDKRAVADLLRVSLSTVNRLLACGVLPAIRVRGRVRFTREDVANYVALQREQARR